MPCGSSARARGRPRLWSWCSPASRRSGWRGSRRRFEGRRPEEGAAGRPAAPQGSAVGGTPREDLEGLASRAGIRAAAAAAGPRAATAGSRVASVGTGAPGLDFVGVPASRRARELPPLEVAQRFAIEPPFLGLFLHGDLLSESEPKLSS